jgi:hypothetical protein
MASSPQSHEVQRPLARKTCMQSTTKHYAFARKRRFERKSEQREGNQPRFPKSRTDEREREPNGGFGGIDFPAKLNQSP